MVASRPDLAPARPAIHLAPAKGWMNDPNGLSHVDGNWHAYYQHNPDEDVWGSIHWRHATSPDLLRWSDHGLALAPTPLGEVYSGSVVVDHTGSAGFGPGARVALLTLASDAGQRQGIAHSADGHTWTMYDGNPVLVDPEQPDFRDPKVIRHRDHWLMTLAVGREVRFFRSDDLRAWELVGHHTPDVPIVGTIECPDLMPVRTRAGEPAWILTYCDGHGGPGGRSITLAVAGDFDGSTFTEWAQPLPLDHGPDFYAAQSFHGVTDDGDPIILGWMSNWPYANTHPSSGRRGVLSLPRSIHIESRADPEVRARLTVPVARAFPERAGVPWTATTDRAMALTGTAFEARVRPAADVGGSGDGAVRVTVGAGRAVLQRFDIGLDGFVTRDEIPTGGDEVTIVFDHGTVEIFASGRTTSALFFAGIDWALETAGSVTARLTGE